MQRKTIDARGRDGERTFQFASTPVLVTLPPDRHAGPTLEGVLQGTWRTRMTSRDTLEVTAIDAALSLDPYLTLIEGVEGTVLFGEDDVGLELTRFEVPAALSRTFGRLNEGTIALRDRWVDTTFGLSVDPPGLGRHEIALRTIGWWNGESLVVAGGIGTIVHGLLSTTIIACAGFRGGVRPEDLPAAPPPTDECDGRCVARQSGPTHDGEDHTDIQKLPVNDGGTTVQIDFQPGATTPYDELGYIEGTYDHVLQIGVPLNAHGFFQKIEVEVTCEAPCVIIEVKRHRTTLEGHDGRPATDEADPLRPHSKAVDLPQRKVVTDAPGLITQQPINRVFHQRYVVTATIQAPDGAKESVSCDYIVLIRTDASGNVDPTPLPP